MKYIILGIAVILSTISCGKDDTQKAQDSLIGSWAINKIVQTITDPQNGNNVQNEESGQLGFFEFSSTSMNYSYSFGGETVTDSQDYSFSVTKENSGFTRVNRYMVEGEKGDYRVRYGDQTSDAHCDATFITLERVFQADLMDVTLYFELNKQ